MKASFQPSTFSTEGAIMNKKLLVLLSMFLLFVGCSEIKNAAENPVIPAQPTSVSTNTIPTELTASLVDSIIYFKDGNFGMGTTDPKVGYKLDVEGGIYSNGGLTCAGNIYAPVISAQNNILSYGGISAMGTISTNGDGYFGGKVQAKSYVFADSTTGKDVDLVALVKQLQARVLELQAQQAQTHTLTR
jgi:hypothetical protein